MADARDAEPPSNGDNGLVVGAESWRGRRSQSLGRPLGGVVAPLFPALGLLALVESIVRSAVTGVSAQRALILGAVAVATTLPPAFLGRVAAAVAVVAACVVSLVLFHTLTVAALPAAAIALYRLGRDGLPQALAQAVAVGLPGVFLVVALASPVPRASEAGVLAFLLAVLGPGAAFAGIAQRARDQARSYQRAREAAAGDLLEHAARGERARIARELHDVVAHHISMIAVQAETARLTTPEMPAEGARRLSAIGDTARSALTEMRRLLGVLREDADAEAAERRPQPGLAQLNELLDEARDASASGARLILSGAPVDLDPGVELAAYRIVQEALTNARRHAREASVDVELRYSKYTLKLRIRDNGPGAPADAPPGGNGLAGMRERAVAVGGRLRTGPAAGGGFLVEATLPTTAAEAVG